jgi:hypothetical protein
MRIAATEAVRQTTTELRRMYDTRKYSIGDLTEPFSISRPASTASLLAPPRPSIPNPAQKALVDW